MDWLSRNRKYLIFITLFLAVGIFVLRMPSQRQWILNITLIGTALTGNLGPTRDLLARGADVNTRDENVGMTPLICAARGDSDVLQPDQVVADHAGVMTELLDRGADINAQDRDGMTALIWAARNGRAPLVKLLIARGADLNVADFTGRTAITWAKAGGHEEVVKVLEKAGAKE
ncbi:hypothetical protein AYO40_02690 [Planctomycetaceae bacterium SCGC AG-212-D15]|nr:hypothetical protein AYO40_02690 [Planctomycetaceae bacterium SCGC AG-212-D15]